MKRCDCRDKKLTSIKRSSARRAAALGVRVAPKLIDSAAALAVTSSTIIMSLLFQGPKHWTVAARL